MARKARGNEEGGWMEHEVMETGLPKALEDQLDQLLAMWGNVHQLAPATSEAIRQTILSDGSMPTWWTSYVNHLNKVIDIGSRYQYSFAFKQGYIRQAPQRTKLQLRITPDWQPYLKLA